MLQQSGWNPDTKECCHRKTATNELSATVRVTIRTKRYERTGMLVEFAVLTHVLQDGEWVERLCIDTCHRGSVHRHDHGNHASYTEIETIDSPKSIQSNLSPAIDEAYAVAEEGMNEWTPAPNAPSR